MRLVIAEKPSVARSIAEVLGAKNRKDGYLEGNNIQVSWCVGHLVALVNADVYNEKYAKWRYEDLPIIPDGWKHEVLTQTRKQFGILKKLMNAKEVSEVICATDAGREGELIFRLVYQEARCKKPVKRLWISSMEESAIKKGFKNLKDGSMYDALYESALCRSKADWLVGINASRLFSVLYRQRLNVGRVQTPTLSMIVDRNQQVKGFQKEKYYVVHLRFGELDAISEHLKTKEEAEKIVSDCNDRMCQVETVDRQKKSVRPPKLYDLTTLQREANRIFGYTAQQTLDYTQSLYEKKLVTYPRTDSQYLTEDMENAVKELLHIIPESLGIANGIECLLKIEQVINSKKVSDHHAIIPTQEIGKCNLQELKKGEKDILYLVSAKLLAATADNYEYESTRATLTCNNHLFSASSIEVLTKGFKEFEEAFQRIIGKTIDKEQPGVELYENKHFGPVNAEMAEQYTKPPKQYSEDTLLAAMERAGNEDVTDDTEKKGIGTPATRAGIIEKLIHAGFVTREKKNLIPTDQGNALITVLPDNIKSPKMTAEWEMELNQIAKGKEDSEQFMHGIEKMIKELVATYHAVTDEKQTQFPIGEKHSLGTCPRCDSPVYEGKKNYYCSNRECKFALWKNDKFLESLGKKMDTGTVKKFLKSGRVTFKNLVSKKTGKSYQADIILDDDNDGYVHFRMEFPNKK